MGAIGHRSAGGEGGRRRWAALALALALAHRPALASQTAVGASPGTSAPGAAAAAQERVPLDSVVAIVNGDLILESDLDAEQRMMAFQPYPEQAPMTPEQLIERLIDRDLILQQMQLQPEPPITDAEVDAELATLRKSIPACASYPCETDAGWQTFVADQGFALDDLRDRWRRRMEVLRFIEERFRMGIRISQDDIDDYYNKTLVPAYRKQKTSPPAEATVADRIQEILLQQQVNSLLDEWLKTLRAQGSVRMLEPGEEKP